MHRLPHDTESTHGMVKKGKWKEEIHRKATHKAHLKAAPRAVPAYSFVLAALEWGHQQSKAATKNKHGQHLHKEQLQEVRRTNYVCHIPLKHTNCFYIQHGQQQVHPILLFHSHKDTEQENRELEPLQSHFFTEEKKDHSHRLNTSFDSDLYI